MQKTSLTVPEKIRHQVFAMVERGESHEAISQYMARAKLEKILAIRLLAQAAHIGLGEAKKIIHLSPAWEFRRAADDEFHATVYSAVKEWKSPRAELGAKPLKTGTR
jgi:hypothetical protein